MSTMFIGSILGTQSGMQDFPRPHILRCRSSGWRCVSWILGLDMAYMAVQLAAILLLVVGVYRFSLLWVSPRAASIAALASFSRLGKLPGLFRRAVGHHLRGANLFERSSISVRVGPAWQVAIFSKASVLFTAAAAAHHATLLFGSIFFAVPVLALAS
jgi:hypothetical protein